MTIRAIGVAVAVVFAMACRTSGSHTREASGTAQAPPADTQGTSGTAQAPSSTTSSGDVSGSTASSAPGSAASSDASGSTASSGAAGSTSSSDVSGSSAPAPSHDAHHGASGSTASSTPGASGGEDPLVVPGPAIKGHASDQVVSGKIEDVSPSSVTISSQLGDRKVLEIAPETDITIDGMDASAADLEEGQEVRASYNEADGQDVAVAIEAGKESPSPSEPRELGGAAGSPAESGSGGMSAPGSSSDTGSAGSSGAGSASEPAPPSGSSGR